MTPEGYKIVCDALASSAEIGEFTVRPEPQPGEDVPKIEITIPGTDARVVHEALGAVGLRFNDSPPNTNPDAPSLAFFSSVVPWKTRRNITLGFSDKNAA